MNAICLVIDRLHAGFLGCYGNAWTGTPQLDRLACESFVADSMLIDTPKLETLCRSYWQGAHALRPEAADPAPTLAGVLADAGVGTALVTDEGAVARHPLAVEFDELIELESVDAVQPARQIDQTRLGRCFAQLIDRVELASEPFFLWCHLRGLAAAWDAPLELRQAYTEPGDPEPSLSTEVPSRRLADDFDPDDLLRFTHAYAGQVTLLDTCIGALHEFLRTSRVGQETLLVLLSARGFPLGEHGRLGPCDEALHGELVHVPALLRFPDEMAAGVRSGALVEPADLMPTLLDWWGHTEHIGSGRDKSLLPLIREDVDTVRDRLIVTGSDGQRAIRTPAWYLRAGDPPELFAKPEDRWEVNDVADRCRNVAERLQDVLTADEQSLVAGEPVDAAPLEDVLIQGLE